MKKHCVAVLGILLQSCGKEELVMKYLEFLSEEPSQAISRHAAAINADDIAAVHGWGISSVRRPELLEAYRCTDIITASGKTLKLLSTLLGSPIQEDIMPKSLLASLAFELGRREKGAFILGRSEKLAKSAAIHLHDSAPGLRIVGIAFPHIYVEGKDLANAPERDSLVIEQINASNADLLVVNLDTAKYEIWFDRVQKDIKSRFTIGIAEVLKTNGKQPEEQKVSLSRIFHSLRAGVASPFNMIKLGWLMGPLVIYHNLNRLAFKLFNNNHQSGEPPRNSLLFLSPQRTIAVISLPSIVDKTNVDTLLNYFEEASSHDILVLDFRWVRHMQPEGFGLLISLWQRRIKENREFYGFCPSRRIKLLMQFHRTWDLFKNRMCFSTDMLIARLSHGGSSEFFDSIYQQGSLAVINFFGVLSNRLDYAAYLKILTPIIEQKECVIDMSYCTFVSNRGFSFLLSLKKMLQEQGHSLTLCSLTPTVCEQFRTEKLGQEFSVVKNIQTIHRKLV